MKFQDELKSLKACRRAITWVGDKTRAQAWAECERGDWMIWYLRKTQDLPKEIGARLAIEFARESLHIVPEGENRPRLALEAAENCLKNPCEETVMAADVAAKVVSEAVWVVALESAQMVAAIQATAYALDAAVWAADKTVDADDVACAMAWTADAMSWAMSLTLVRASQARIIRQYINLEDLRK